MTTYSGSRGGILKHVALCHSICAGRHINPALELHYPVQNGLPTFKQRLQLFALISCYNISHIVL